MLLCGIEMKCFFGWIRNSIMWQKWVPTSWRWTMDHVNTKSNCLSHKTKESSLCRMTMVGLWAATSDFFRKPNALRKKSLESRWTQKFRRRTDLHRIQIRQFRLLFLPLTQLLPHRHRLFRYSAKHASPSVESFADALASYSVYSSVYSAWLLPCLFPSAD